MFVLETERGHGHDERNGTTQPPPSTEFVQFDIFRKIKKNPLMVNGDYNQLHSTPPNCPEHCADVASDMFIFIIVTGSRIFKQKNGVS
jgi:hypothetical protein